MNKVTIIHPRLQHLGMTTANIDSMLTWYRIVLGMDLVHRTGAANGAHNEGQVLKAAWVTNDEDCQRFSSLAQWDRVRSMSRVDRGSQCRN